MQIILASASFGRKKILESLGLSFKIIPSDIDETKFNRSKPIALAQTLAKAKAERVFEKIKNQQCSHLTIEPLNYLIIAADSMVLLNGETIGKPKDKKEAKKILKKLSGKTHQFLTAVYVLNIKTKKVWQKTALSKVTFRKMKDWEIEVFLKKVDPTVVAGGYSLDHPQDFITKVEGSLTNVLGLPLEILLPILRENNILI